jgi:hypothetical protein
MLSKYNVTVPIACKIRPVKTFGGGSPCRLVKMDGLAGCSRYAASETCRNAIEKQEHKPNCYPMLASSFKEIVRLSGHRFSANFW